MNIRKRVMLLLLGFLLMNIQCEEDDTIPLPYCNGEMVIDASVFETSESHPIVSAMIDGNCLEIVITASGCDSNNWTMLLIDAGVILESSPPQRNLKMALYNDEVCLAVFDKADFFDIRSLRIDGENEVFLNIEGLESQLLYTY
jgi:hypothetical protein